MAGTLNRPSHPASQQALAILYDLALTIGGQISLTPLLTRFLQRLMYHTGYPVGLFFEEIGQHPSGASDLRRASLRIAVGDFSLIRRQGESIDLPADLLASPAALLDDENLWAALKLRKPVTQAIRLPVGDQGVMLLFGTPATDAVLPYSELFAPVLENLARAIVFCRNYEQSYQNVVDSYSNSLTRQQLYGQVLANTRDGVLITDTDLKIIDCTAAFTEITGFSREEVIGRKVPLSPSGMHDPQFYETMWQEITRTGGWQGEIWNRRKNGEVELDLVRIGAVRDSQGQVSNYFAIYTDIHELKSFQKRLERMANFDALTELPNATYFTQQLENAIARARRLRTALAVIYIDIDNFGEINEAHGKNNGDLLIQNVGQRLLEQAPAGAMLGRVGGDEFALMLADLRDWHAAESHVDELLTAFVPPFVIKGESIEVAASFGVTVFPDDDADAGGLLRHAQVSMYRAKDEARGRGRFFDPDQNQAARKRRTLLSRIEKALRNEEFRLYYQPKIELASGRLSGFEALLRWQDPELGLIPPGDFLPEAEQHEIIIDIGEWVMRDALRQAVRWEKAGLSCNISVNIAAQHLQLQDFGQRVRHAMACVPGARPAHLGIEILESAAISNLHHVHSLITAGQDEGFEFSLDDFGTGYSSLAYLRELPVNTLKIDQTFVRNLFCREGDAAIVQAVVGIADAFGRQLVAEGIESVEHGMLLASLGCGLAQGYGIGRPMPAQAVNDWCANFCIFPQWPQWSRRPWNPAMLPQLKLRHDHHAWLGTLPGLLQKTDHDPACVTDSPILLQARHLPDSHHLQQHLGWFESSLTSLRRHLSTQNTSGVHEALQALQQTSQKLIAAFDAALV